MFTFKFAIGIIFIMTQSNKSRPHKITGLPSCWFYFAGIVKRAEDLSSASLVTLALCTKTYIKTITIYESASVFPSCN